MFRNVECGEIGGVVMDGYGKPGKLGFMIFRVWRFKGGGSFGFGELVICCFGEDGVGDVMAMVWFAAIYGGRYGVVGDFRDGGNHSVRCIRGELNYSVRFVKSVETVILLLFWR